MYAAILHHLRSVTSDHTRVYLFENTCDVKVILLLLLKYALLLNTYAVLQSIQKHHLDLFDLL